MNVQIYTENAPMSSNIRDVACLRLTAMMMWLWANSSWLLTGIKSQLYSEETEILLQI
jgi:hypothetical protein